MARTIEEVFEKHFNELHFNEEKYEAEGITWLFIYEEITFIGEAKPADLYRLYCSLNLLTIAFNCAFAAARFCVLSTVACPF